MIYKIRTASQHFSTRSNFKPRVSSGVLHAVFASVFIFSLSDNPKKIPHEINDLRFSKCQFKLQASDCVAGFAVYITLTRDCRHPLTFSTLRIQRLTSHDPHLNSHHFRRGTLRCRLEVADVSNPYGLVDGRARDVHRRPDDLDCWEPHRHQRISPCSFLKHWNRSSV
jgi:hypothetical protein